MRATREAPTYARSEYDPNKMRVQLAADASAYQQAHETAHKWQQETQTLAWRAHTWAMRKLWFNRWTRLWLEIEATRMALRTMRWLGTWTYAAQVEARKSLLTYCSALFI